MPAKLFPQPRLRTRGLRLLQLVEANAPCKTAGTNEARCFVLRSCAAEPVSVHFSQPSPSGGGLGWDGAGRIGVAAARRALSIFRMRVL